MVNLELMETQTQLDYKVKMRIKTETCIRLNNKFFSSIGLSFPSIHS